MSTTPYAISTNTGSQTFAGFVNSSINGPLNSAQYPLAMPYHNRGLLPVHNTPPQFVSSPVSYNMFVLAKAQYLRATALSAKQKAIQDAQGKTSNVVNYVSKSTQRQVPVSTHVNYIPPIDGSQYVNIKKSISVGKSSYNVGLPSDALTGTKSYDQSYTRSCLKRARSHGTVSCKKKSSIYNTSLRQPGINAWGAIPRQNY